MFTLVLKVVNFALVAVLNGLLTYDALTDPKGPNRRKAAWLAVVAVLSLGSAGYLLWSYPQGVTR